MNTVYDLLIKVHSKNINSRIINGGHTAQQRLNKEEVLK